MMKLVDMQGLGPCAARRGGSNPLPGTIEEIASFEGSPRFARRLICIGFSGQKRIGDFERRKENFLILNPIKI